MPGKLSNLFYFAHGTWYKMFRARIYYYYYYIHCIIIFNYYLRNSCITRYAKLFRLKVVVMNCTDYRVQRTYLNSLLPFNIIFTIISSVLYCRYNFVLYPKPRTRIGILFRFWVKRGMY